MFSTMEQSLANSVKFLICFLFSKCNASKKFVVNYVVDICSRDTKFF